jgi:LEA14-like dessication related protein
MAYMSVWKFIAILCVVGLSGCTNLQQLEELEVSLINIEPTTATGLSPRFNVHLLVLNPNAQDLEIEGLMMNLDINDKKILSGVSSQIPTLKAYSETAVEIQTAVNLFDLFKLLTYLSQHSGNNIKYQLKTKIDPKGFIAFNLNKEGFLNENLLQGLSNQTR